MDDNYDNYSIKGSMFELYVDFPCHAMSILNHAETSLIRFNVNSKKILLIRSCLQLNFIRTSDEQKLTVGISLIFSSYLNFYLSVYPLLSLLPKVGLLHENSISNWDNWHNLESHNLFIYVFVEASREATGAVSLLDHQPDFSPAQYVVVPWRRQRARLSALPCTEIYFILSFSLFTFSCFVNLLKMLTITWYQTFSFQAKISWSTTYSVCPCIFRRQSRQALYLYIAGEMHKILQTTVTNAAGSGRYGKNRSRR